MNVAVPSAAASRTVRIVVPVKLAISRVESCTEARAQAAVELDRGVDLRLSDGDALDVDADGQMLFARVGVNVGEDAFAEVDGAVERVARMAQLVLEPARERDAEPLHELERAHRAAG